MGWLGYVIGFAIVLGAVGVLAWALLRQARGRGGCGSGCCACSYFQADERCTAAGRPEAEAGGDAESSTASR